MLFGFVQYLLVTVNVLAVVWPVAGYSLTVETENIPIQNNKCLNQVKFRLTIEQQHAWVKFEEF